MLRTALLIMACTLCWPELYAQVKVGENPLVIDDASLIEIESTSKGFLPSRMTSAQRDLQTSWETGHIIFNLTDSCLQVYSGTEWDCFVKGVLVDSTVYKYDGALTSDRTIDLDGSSFTFDGPGAQDVIIQSDGDVGIGTTTPNAKLDVENGTVRFSEYGTGLQLGTGYILGVDTDGDVIEIDTSSFLADNQDLSLTGDSLFLTNDATGVDLSEYAIDSSIYKYNGTLPEARTLTLGGFDLTFSGTNNVTFESTGELGVGEPTPDAPIHITESNGTSASATDGTLILEHSDNGGASSLVFKSSEDEGSDFGYIQYEDDGSGNGSNNQNSLLTIGAGNDAAGTAGQDDIAILPSGNVGIGTTAPDELLHVAGDMRLDGSFEDKDGDAGSSGQVLTSTATGTDWVDPTTVGTDDQNLSDAGKTGNNQTIDIEDGNSVTFSVADADSSTTNEIQTIDLIDLSGTDLRLSLSDDGEVPQTVDLSPLQDGTGTDDQNLSDAGKTGNNQTIDIEDGNSVTFSVADADSSTTNEIQTIDLMELSGTTLSLSLDNDGEVPVEVDLDSLRRGSIDLHDDVDITTDTPDSGDVLAWDGANFVPQETDNGYTIFSIWAEESQGNPSLTNNDTEWSFGNGDEAPAGHGIVIPMDCELWAMSLDHENGDSTVVRIIKNSDDTLSDYEVTTNGTELGYDVFSTPLIFNAGDVLNFKTISVTVGGNSGRVTAWLRIRSTPASNSLLEDLMDVSAGSITNGQVLIYNGATFVPGDLTTDTDTNLSQEEVQDFVGSMVTGNTETGINVTYDDANDEFDFIAADDSPTNEIQTIDSFTLTGNTLAISLESDGEDPLTVDLSTITGSTENIYNTSDSLEADRIVTLDGNNLTFNGTGAGDVIIESDGDVGIGTTNPSARLHVDGGSVRLSDYGQGNFVDTSANTILTVQPDGDVRELNTAKNTRWFYPPAVVIDASSLDTMATLDLHADYVDQFSNPLVSNPEAVGFVPYYLESQLDYYITYFDDDVLDNISIDANGVMTYDVIAVPFDNYTVINVVFVIKDP